MGAIPFLNRDPSGVIQDDQGTENTLAQDVQNNLGTIGDIAETAKNTVEGDIESIKTVKDILTEPPAPAKATAAPKPADRQKAELDAEAAKIAFQKRMAAKQGYAGTFHASEPTRSSVGPNDVFRPPRQAGEPSMMDRLKWSRDPVWLFGPKGPFSGVKLPTPNPNSGSQRLQRK